MSTAREHDWSTWALRWVPAGVVALGAAVATAHGLYEVAVAARVPDLIAWLYPLITDGLAMVAYAATARLSGRASGYAWSVVVLTAALSGLAQAAYLATDTLQAHTVLRFGVGAWPAVAIALVAHLLHLLAADSPAPDTRHVLQEDAPRAAAPERPAKPRFDEQAQPAPAPHTTPAPAPVTEHVDETPEPAAADPTPDTDVDPRVVELARRLAGGEDLTGPAIGAELEVSDRTGRRLLAEARTYLDENPQTPPRHGLHLITRTSAGGTA